MALSSGEVAQNSLSNFCGRSDQDQLRYQADPVPAPSQVDPVSLTTGYIFPYVKIAFSSNAYDTVIHMIV